MDTKLKKSKYNPIIKLVAVLLTIIFAFFTGVNALNYLRKAVFYADNTLGFKSTPTFAYELKNAVNNIYQFKDATEIYESDLSYEDYLKTDKAKEIIKSYNEKEERAVKLFNTIQDLKKLRPKTIETNNGTYNVDENGIVYFPEEDSYISANEFYNYYNEFYYDGEYYEQATSVMIYDYEGEKVDYPSNDEELFAIKDKYTSYSDWNYKYQQLRSAIFSIVEDAISEEQIRKEIQDDVDFVLEEEYSSDIETTTYHLNQLRNVKFILKNNETGNVISNVKKSDRQDFIKSLDYNDIFHIEFDGKKLLSKPNVINRSTNLLKFLTDAHTLEYEAVDQNYLTEYFSGYSLYVKIGGTTLAPADGDNFYQIIQTYNSLSHYDSDTYLRFTGIFALLSIICFIWCCFISGKRKDGSIKLAPTDKILFVIYLAFTVALVGAAGFGVFIIASMDFNCSYMFGNSEALQWIFTPKLSLNLIGLGFAIISILLLSFVLYIIRNVRAGTFGNTFVIIYFKRKIKSRIEKARLKAAEKEITPEQIKRRIKTQTILFFVGYVAINVFFYLFAFGYLFPVSIIGLIIFNGLAITYAMLYISDVLRLAKVAEEIRKGNYKTTININNYVKPLRLFASDLSACRDGIENAINEAIKGEHLKTELITNVSHDLKTPLTSIINYVSLLKMDNIAEEEKQQYIDILDEKSKKLKRLIEDLTEASKANSGNIKMNVAQVNLNEMALQAVGENSDVLENAGLDVILTEKDKEIIVAADSQHTFRIIDNLFSNAKKYSLTGTRVYVDVYKENGFGVFEIKNISKEKLNIDPEELTERFVRGDNSRTTDGSGLGLSIARSFAELQNGIFNIEIDGDMFKAVVKLPLI